jgi:hypothetical protein
MRSHANSANLLRYDIFNNRQKRQQNNLPVADVVTKSIQNKSTILQSLPNIYGQQR